MSELPKGGVFLLEEACSREFFTPEKFDKDMLGFASTVKDFIINDVMPRKEFDDNEAKLAVNRELLAKAGELGVLMVDIPEEYGGMGLGMNVSMLISEKVAIHPSFATTVMAHNGIGTLPIVYFGSEYLKKKYLPKLATGEWAGAYALTESNFGSDALGAKTKAVLSEDGKYYILNGEKVFITNSGFADMFIVYAQVDGKFSSFVIEASWDGVSTGPEEDKVGIHGSSTRSVIFDDVKIPVENMLDHIGKGHKSALGILDIGRLKLGIASLGGCKRMLDVTIPYAKERKQFKTPIAGFGMIKRKFASMASKTYALESMSYRTASLIDEAVEALDKKDPDYSKKAGDVFKEYEIEASIMKVYGSERLGEVVDDAVQIHGGYGFILEYEPAQAYIDCRINRIFEGTNEINRLTMIKALLGSTMKGKLDFMGSLTKVLDEVKADSVNKEYGDQPADREKLVAEIARKITVYAAGVVVQKFMAQLMGPDAGKFIMGDGEYYFEKLADLIMEVYAMDSAVQRTRQLVAEHGAEKLDFALNCTTLFCYEGLKKVTSIAKQVLIDTAADDEKQLGKYMKALSRLSYDYSLNSVVINNKITDYLYRLEKYFIV